MRVPGIDVLKFISIAAVILYHLGVSKFAYFGADIFLLIGGFFAAQSIDNQSYIIGGGKFITRRLCRILPTLLAADIVCLTFGYFLMLPDDYENLTESVVASNLFGNNILEAITTRNYWAQINEFKPLMTTWFLGILMQFYAVVTIINTAANIICKDNILKRAIIVALFFLSALFSLNLYLTTWDSTPKFYYLHYRLFELCGGALCYYLSPKGICTPLNYSIKDFIFIVSYIMLIGALFIDAETGLFVDRQVCIILFSAVIMILMKRTKVSQNFMFSNGILAKIGSASLSLFIWHQVIFALTRYSFTTDLLSPTTLFIISLILVGITYLSYRYIEKLTMNKRNHIITFIITITVTIYALHIYSVAGVVRDVPELDIKQGESHRGMWAEYVDGGFKYDRDFEDSTKLRLYVIGNSFGRDFVNIVTESKICNSVEISYSDNYDYVNHPQRFADADIVVCSSLGYDESLIEDITSRCTSKSKLIIVGEKNFGRSNGQVYRHRFDGDYLLQTMTIDSEYIEKNDKIKHKYRDSFIDLIRPVMNRDGKVRVFTDDGKLISQDCMHLTKAGAKFYAELIDWKILGL